MITALRFTLPSLLLLSACTKGEKVPAYIDIPAVGLTTTVLQGSSTRNIPDAWVYADDELLGIWELPARIPVLKDGPTTIRVVPGIKRNGAFDDRLTYPFYTAWTGTTELVRTATSTLAPSVEYTASADFWIEAFEDPGFLFFVSDTADELLRFTPQQYPDVVLDNTPCAGFVLDGSNPYMRFYTDEDFIATGGPTFLELDYRSDLTLTVGMFYVSEGVARAEPYVYIMPTQKSDGTMPWKKIYIDLSPVFNLGISQRDIYFESSLPSTQGGGRVYIDNVKLVR